MPAKRDTIIIDGQNFLFRAHYAHQKLQTSDGVRTSCIYGVLSMLYELLLKHPRTDFVFIWDHFLPTGHRGNSLGTVVNFKQEIGNGIYKTKRQKSDESNEALAQGRLLVPVLEKLGFLQLGVPGLEADDLIGICATAVSPVANTVLIVSGDTDMLQLCGGNIRVMRPKKPQGYRVLGPDEVFQEYKVKPSKFAKYLALGGDKSDDYKAIKNVGPKKAALLVNDGLDPSVKVFKDLPPDVQKRHASLAANWDHIYRCYKLAYIPRTSSYRLLPPVVQEMAGECVRQIIEDRRRTMSRHELAHAEASFKRFCEVYEMEFLRQRAFTFLKDATE